MERVDLKFIRTGTFTMSGGVSVDVENALDWEEIFAKANSHQFAEMLPTEIKYKSENWTFEPLQTEEELEDGAA